MGRDGAAQATTVAPRQAKARVSPGGKGFHRLAGIALCIALFVAQAGEVSVEVSPEILEQASTDEHDSRSGWRNRGRGP